MTLYFKFFSKWSTIIQKKAPFGVALAHCMHKLSRSKHLIVLFNRLGFSESYDELEKEYIDLVQRTLDRTGDHRVPLPPSIKSKIVIHSAVDNFDKSDDTSGSHDTILMFF